MLICMYYMCTYDNWNMDLVTCQTDDDSSSRYSWKIDKNKEDQTENTFSKHGKSNCPSLWDSD